MELPTGFRFYPTEEELINFYLLHKLHCSKPEIDRVIPSIDIYNFEPVQIPELAGQLCQGETEKWFFFVPQQEREVRGGRPNRTTGTGYWKATGSTSLVYSSDNKVIGIKKTMVFYKGKAPTGCKTKWKMNEYKAIKQEDNNIINNIIGQNYNANNIIVSSSSSSSTIIPHVRSEMSLCRVYVTSGCARAFDRRPPGTSSTTTTSLNNYNTSTTQNNVNTSTFDYTNMEIGQGIRSGTTLLSTNAAQISMDNEDNDCSNYNLGRDDHGTHQGYRVIGAIEGSNNNNCCDDIEMTQSLDTLIDWEQLGWL